MTATDRPLSEADQLEALTRGAAVAVPGLRSALAVTGADHRAWLDRILSNSVKDLAPKRVVRATLMDGKGRLRADLSVLSVGVEGGMLLDVPASHREALLRVLEMFILRDKVTLTDLGRSHAWVSVLGPQACETAQRAGSPCPEAGRALSSDRVVAAVASHHYGQPGIDMLVPADGVEAKRQRMIEAGARPVGREALEVVRIAAGIPWFAEDLTDNVIPLEAGLDDHVSISKGCYPGQEVVARIHNLGQVARKLVRLSADGHHDLVAGEPLFGTGEAHDKEAGKLTSVAWDPRTRTMVALGFVRRAFWKAGGRVRAGAVELEVADLRAG